ncbi:hypothetical protein L0E39_06840 [Klebsiella pneumoniae]|nr:hypothetical protein [Klebsiella pneumoniae]
MFAGKKSAQIREILINESAWEEMTCLFALSLTMCAIEAANELVIFPARNITISTVGGTIIRRKNENQPGRMMNIWHLVLKIDVLL